MKDGSKFARKGIMNMAPYIAGKPIEEVQREYGLTDVIKLASNENSLHTSPMAVKAMQAEAENCYLYPEGSSPYLREKLAKKVGVDADQIIVGDGGDHVIGMMCHAFVSEGDEVIVPKPGFRTYGLNTTIMGGVTVEVPCDENHCVDLDAMLAAITPKTKFIWFCNPNNPTSTIIGRAKVEEFMSKVPEDVIVVFDEAYCEFIDDPDYPNGVEYVKQERNVFVIRTFSKIYGLAGVRIGYAIGPKHLIDVLGRVVPFAPVGRLSQVGAAAAMDDVEFLTAAKKANDDALAYLCKEFDEMGMSYPKPYANFIWVDLHMPVAEINIELLKRGIIIRPGTQWGAHTTARVTTGTMEENKRLIAALKELQKQYQK